MIEAIALPPGLFNFVLETLLLDGSIAASVQSRQVAVLYFAITSLHSPHIPDHSSLLDIESDIELEDHTMGRAYTEWDQLDD